MILYKYLPPTRLDVLSEQLIRFTQPLAFNDPFDSHSYVSDRGKAKDLWEGLSPDEKEKGDFGDENTFKRIASSLSATINMGIEQLWYKDWSSKVGILCLSEVKDNLLMWAHYADSHKGFVIGLDIKHPAFEHLRGEYQLRKVQYSGDRPDVPPIREGPAWSEIYFTKSVDWEYEQEWRLIRPLEDAPSKLSLEPYAVHRFKLPFAAVREIILGCCIAEETSTQLLRLLKESEQQRKVRVLVATKHVSAYKVDVLPFITVTSDGWQDA